LNKGQFAGLLFQSFMKMQKRDFSLKAAALTFFTILPLPPLALIAVAFLAQLYGPEAMQQLIIQITSIAGPAVANLFAELLLDAQSPLTGFFGSFLAIIFALAGALGAFSVLQKSIDDIWEIRAQERGRTDFIKEKMRPFTLVISISVIVVVATAVSTVLFNIIVFVLSPLLGGFSPYLVWFLQIMLSFGLGTFLFAVIFKELPETKVEWRDVWPASLLIGGIFTALNYIFGLYLSLVQVTTLAGTAGALIVLLLWIYLVNLFILFGAQFSKVYAQAFGSHHNKPPVLKWPLRPPVEHLEIITEVKVKLEPVSNNKESGVAQ
jgi:membrane protein